MKNKLLTLVFVLAFVLVMAFSVSAVTTVTPGADELGNCVINGEVVNTDGLLVTQGMSYTVLDEEAKTVALSSRGSTDSFTGAVVIPSTIKIDGVDYSVVETNAEVFKGTSITKIYVPDTVVEIIGYSSGNDTGTFANCNYLSEVYIGTGIKVIGRFAFTSIGKSSAVTVFYVAGKVQELGEYAFNAANFADDCEITFDSTDMRKIGPRVFDNGSKSLKRIDSAKLESIGERGFASSKSLEYILIPEYCTVGLYAFNGVDNLQTAIIRSASDEIKEIPKEMFSSGTSGYKTNIYIKGRVQATEWAVLPGRAFNIYMDSYENAKYFVDSIMLYGHSSRVANGTWYFCTPYNGYYCFSSNGSFSLTAKTDVTISPHIAIYSKGVETQATCNQYAGIGDICEVCGIYFNVTQTGSEYDESAHNYSWISHTEPQCIVTGLDVYECIYCKDTIEEVIPVLGHDYAKETVAPTCSLIGYTNNVCSRCDYSIITDKVDKTPHSYLGNGFVLDGINISYTTECKYCGIAGDSVEETLVNKCYIEGYGIFDATLEYLSISEDGTVTPSGVTFDNAVIYFPSYVEIDGNIVEVKTIQGFKSLSIKGVYIPDTVTRLVGGSNGTGCFQNVYDLKNIVVGKGITEIEAYVFYMYGKSISLDEFIFTNTIQKLGSRSLARLNASSSDIPYQFDTRLTYIGAYVSVDDRTGGNLLREVYVTNGCDLTEKFAFNAQTA
ncbi:MAG: leucine-rich repeat protein [Clostridia bacterium]|nr:leucine-rich repeat protein [Clostridia bacterium]